MREHWLGKLVISVMFFLCVGALSVGLLEGCAQKKNGEDKEEERGEQSDKSDKDGTEAKRNFSNLVHPENLNLQGYDVVYVIDNSKSVWGQKEIRNQAFRNISNLAVGSDIRIGGVYFADQIYRTLSLTSMDEQEGSKKVLEFLTMEEEDKNNIDTNIGNALEKAFELFDSQDSSRRRIIILFSDGINENFAQEGDYKEAAKSNTADQVQRLQEKDVQIYCVYLQKDRNDEKYLKDLVNYFPKKENKGKSKEKNKDKNKDYAAERFFKLTEDEINTLPDKFSDVFYAMQNNMKCRKISLDSSGAMRFYVPSLGIKKMQIYVDGNYLFKEVNPAGESEFKPKEWKDNDGRAEFVQYDNPNPGEWSLNVDTKHPDKIFGAIACYTYLQAAVEAIPESSSETSSDKNKPYQIIVHFYDEDGDEVKIDPMTQVSVRIVFSDKEAEPKDLTMTIEDGAAKSDLFEMGTYGDFSYKINVSYEDFVNLEYSVKGGSVEKMAPIAHNIEKKVFQGEKNEDGEMVFSIKESSLYEDPEGEDVKIIGIVQLNAANKVRTEAVNGYINVIAENTGDVNFALQLMDASGMGAEVEVQGTVKDQGVGRMIKNIVIIFVVCFVICIILLLCLREGKKKRLEAQFKELKRMDKKFWRILADFQKDCEKMQENEEAVKNALEGFGEGEGYIKGIKELADLLTEEQKEDFALREYLEDGFETNLFQRAREIELSVDKCEKSIKACREQWETLEIDKKNINGMELKIYYEETLEALLYVEQSHKELQQENKILSKKIMEMGGAAKTVETMLNTEIVCDLILKKIKDMDVNGRKSCRDIIGEYQKGYYKLDDVIILTQGKLGDCIGSTGIYVYGYEDENGNAGLELRSTKDFSCEIWPDEVEVVSQKAAGLLRGKEYEVKIQSDYQKETLTIYVQ